MTMTAPSHVAPTIPGPDPRTRAPRFKLPAGSCDCHAHLFGPQDRYAYDPKRRYTPPDATLDDYIEMLSALGVERGVLVQPSVYMTENVALLDALALKRFPLRGVVVVEPSVTDAELERMNALGVRGIRLNLRFENGASADVAPVLAKRIAPLGWHLQFRIDAKDFPTVESMLQSLPVDIVVDHIG